MNEFVEAAKNSEDSKDRYEKVKKEEAGTDNIDPAKQRYDELKDKAKEEYEKKEEKRKREEEKEQEEDEEDESFVTY